jgi:stage II sporulation protein D
MRCPQLCTILFLLLIAIALSQSLATPEIRVLLDSGLTSVSITFSDQHRGFVDGILRFDATSGLEWQLEVRDGWLHVDEEPIGYNLTFEPVESLVSWGGRQYRGAIQFVAFGDQLRVVNLLGLEEYLRGVVPAEMQASWPLEALKAQAVAARSYTLANLDYEGPYDICATVQCQVYHGVSVEHPRSDRAVSETSGIILTHDGDLARTYYHSDSGGTVASSAEVWGVTEPYLVSRTDVTAYTPHRNWRFRVDPSLVASTLRELGSDVGPVVKLQVLGYSESGRVSQLKVFGSVGSKVMEGETLNKIVRQWGLKSASFVLLDSLTAQGNGWGHGVGMSQYGAKALAQFGYNYGEILTFYYPGTRLAHINSGWPP